MLFIDYDIMGSRIDTPAFTLNSFVSTLPVTKYGTTPSGCYVTPDKTTMTIEPVQYQDAWASQPKLQLSDWNLGNSTQWTQANRRATGDWFITSKGYVTAPVSTLAVFPRNVGFYLEAWIYTKPDTTTYSILDFNFGSFFTMFLHSDGTIDLFDSRVSNQVPIASGSITNNQSVAGKFVAITILPCRKEYILISSNLGGFVSAKIVNSFVDYNDTVNADPNRDGLYVITESSSVSLFQLSEPIQSNFCLSVLQYPTTASYTVNQQLNGHVMNVAPTLTAQCDQEHKTTCTLTPTTAFDSTATTYSYSINLTASNGTATIQGSTSPAYSLGKLYTSFDYINRVDNERTLGTNVYNTNTLPSPIKAELRLDKDRSQSSFSFTLDNPNDEWTALAEFENRRVYAYLDLPSNHGGSTQDDIDDPDYNMVTGNEGPISVFFGYSDQPDFTDGTKSEITINCTGAVKRLRHTILSDVKNWDNQDHRQCVLDVLKIAGFAADEDVTNGDFPTSEIYIYDDGSTPDILPESGSGTEPAWQPRQGATAEEFLQEVTDYSGWDLFESNGIWYYVPQSYEVATLISAYGVPVVYSANNPLSENGGVVSQSSPNCPIQFIAALDGTLKEQIDELVANSIWVYGTDSDGNPLVCNYDDIASQTDKTAVNYVGARWLFIYISPSLCTIEAVTAICTIFAQNLPYPTRKVTFALPDYRPELQINSPVHVQNFGDGLVTGITCDFSCDRFRRTEYVVELVNEVD